MRIAIIALGSRGDVQPYVALGLGLEKAGHKVRLVTHEAFEDFVKSYGLEFWPVRGDMQAVIQNPEINELLEKGEFIAITIRTARAAKEAARFWAEDSLEACRGTDLIMAGVGGVFIGLALAEKLDLPFMQAYNLPFTPTAAFPSVLLPGAVPGFGGTFNRITHKLTRQGMWQGSRGSDKIVRREVLGLPTPSFLGPFKSSRLNLHPVLYGYSPSVVPKPADWGDNIQVTGYWFLDEAIGWTPPPALLEFLDKGPAPVYVGFGSMVSRQPEETAELILQALARTGQRAILLSGWGGLKKAGLPDSIFMADSIPHSWLFPRVSAVVHHGGAGTTAAGIRAGVPSIITPFFADQFFWGQRVAGLGIGPKPVPRKKLTVEALAQALQLVQSDEGMRERAAKLGEIIRAEDGIERAVEIIQATSENFRRLNFV